MVITKMLSKNMVMQISILKNRPFMMKMVTISMVLIDLVITNPKAYMEKENSLNRSETNF